MDDSRDGTAGTDVTDDGDGTVGFLYPGYSAEDDYPRMEALLRDSGDPRAAGVRLPLVHTDMGTDAHRVDALLEMGAVARLAAGVGELKRAGARAVVWACTSASFVYGWEGAGQQVTALSEAAGLPASSTSFAFAHAVAELGVSRVAIAATYPEDVAGLFAEFLKVAGAEVVGTRGSGIITAAEVGTWGREDVLRIAREGDDPAAQAVLLPDTALHTAAWVAELESELGKPVLTANQVTAWEGLRLLGRTVRVPALGALFDRA
ncbi:Maleate isomerase [Streptomyces sp. enrichment culture]|jgi:maleate cis-trans isomerase|uniref:maleate cis-trans isomerase family protein n=1 Tax=Streptomyces xiamenensis TaxID=408015 RepID=UPI0037D2F8D4